MTDNTRSCDEVAKYLEVSYPGEFNGKVLVIHTNGSGEFAEGNNKKAKEELDRLRDEVNAIDSKESPYVAVVSVMMLREGWDVRNDTTIVGLRPFTAGSKVLPEQALGRGLRKMYPKNHIRETLSVIGTDAFFEFVSQITKDGGPTLECAPMGNDAEDVRETMVVEVDWDNQTKDITKLDIELPILRARVVRDYDALAQFNENELEFEVLPFREFGEAELREIVFHDIVEDCIDHTTTMESVGRIESFSDAVGFFAHRLKTEVRLVSGYDVLFGAVKRFLRNRLYGHEIDTESRNTLRNLAEPNVSGCVMNAFRTALNKKTLREMLPTEIAEMRKLSKIHPFFVKKQEFISPTKSVFNKIVSDRSGLELDFARFLERCPDVVAYGKNYRQVGFKLDYIDVDGNISQYYPDFFVRCKNGKIYVVETKGEVEINVPRKCERLRQWVSDVNALSPKNEFVELYVTQTNFELAHTTWQTFSEFAEFCTSNQ